MSRNEADVTVSAVSFISSSFFGVYDQNPIRKFGLLFHRTSRKV
jgi:hypothetical protein